MTPPPHATGPGDRRTYDRGVRPSLSPWIWHVIDAVCIGILVSTCGSLLVLPFYLLDNEFAEWIEMTLSCGAIGGVIWAIGRLWELKRGTYREPPDDTAP